MCLDDGTTAHQLHRLLQGKGYNLSLETILRCRSSLGWTFRGSAYCQLIRGVNMEKRLAWALKYKDDTFDDVIFTDECTVQMESHRRFCCRKQGEPPRLKPRSVFTFLTDVIVCTVQYAFRLSCRPKHPYKVHVWAGISLRGRTGICIFTGTVDRHLYIDILKETLLPLLVDVYPDCHRLMADNDLKHISVAA